MTMMRRFAIAAVVVGGLGSAACSKEAPGGGAGGAAGTAPASASPAAAAKAMARLRGTWVVQLSPKQEKDLATMRLVFDAQEPTAEQLAALGPDERSTILGVREARKKAPDDPQFAEMRAVLDGMGKSMLIVNTTSIALSVGSVRQDAMVVIKTETSTSVTLTATTKAGKREDIALNLTGDDVVTLSKPNQKDALTFRRQR